MVRTPTAPGSTGGSSSSSNTAAATALGAPGSSSGTTAVDGSSGKYPEFKGNVKLVETDPFWDREANTVLKKGVAEHKDEWNKVGSDAGYHYLGSAKTFCALGKAFGEAMIELQRSAAAKGEADLAVPNR